MDAGAEMPEVDWEELLAFDRAHVWHPYAALPAAAPPLPVTSAFGTRLRLADGRELVDGMSSWWAAIWGYHHPVIDEALRQQLGVMSHVMFGGLTHAPAVTLAKRLVSLAPPGLDRVFFADSGSVSVEVALKTAVQYQRNLGHSGRVKFLALSGGYHGDTLGAMGVCDPVGGMHHLFNGAVPENWFAPRPPRARAWTATGSKASATCSTSTTLRSPRSSRSPLSKAREGCGSTTVLPEGAPRRRHRVRRPADP